MKSRTTIVLIALALLLGGLVVLDSKKGTTTSESESKRKRLIDFKSDEVTHLEVGHTNQTVVIDKAGDRWLIKQPLNVRASAGAVSSVLGELEFTERERTIAGKELGGAKLADFGLAPPRLRLVLGEKKRAFTLLIGGETATKDGLYVQIEGQPDICIINKGAFAQLDKSLSDLREREIFEFSPAATTRLEIKTGPRSIELVKSAATTNAQPRWAISRPLAARADQDKVSELLTGLSALRVSDFVSEDPKDVHTYGLDEPDHEVTAWAGAGDAGKTLLLGRALTNDATKVYAKIKGADSIVTVPATDANKLALQVNDLRDHRILNLTAADVHGIELQRGADVLAFNRDTNGWKVAGIPAEESIVNSMLNQIVNLTAKEFTADVAADLDKYGLAPAPVTITLRGAQTNVLAQLQLGTENPVASFRYVKRADEAFVYGVEHDAIGNLPSRALEARARHFVDIKPDSITKLTFQHHNGTFVFEREAGKSWRLVEPSSGVFDADRLTKIVDILGDLRPEYFIRDGLDDLAAFNLDKPEFTLTVQAAEKTWTLALAGRHASWSDPAVVLMLPVQTAETLTRNLVTTPSAPATNAAPAAVVTPPVAVPAETR